jgi:uncharacterized membrane protein
MTDKKPNPLSNLSMFRLEALEDGVFAIAMTLLVLNLKVPTKSDNSLFKAIMLIWPDLLTFFGSFLLLGVYWFGHRASLHYVKHADNVYHWLNLIILMFVSIVPFSASLISKFYGEQTAIILYGLNLITIGVTITVQWYYASHNYRLIDPQLPIETIRFAKIRSMFAPISYTIAILLSFIDMKISFVIYTITPILYIFPIFMPFWRKLAKIPFL